MPAKKSVGLFILSSLVVTLLTSSFVLMAPLAARFMRLQFGRWPYWIFAAVSSLALMTIVPQWAFYQCIVMLLVGIFADLEDHHLPLFYSSLSSVALTVLTVLLVLAGWARSQQTTLVPFLKQQINASLELAQQIPNFKMVVEVQDIVVLVPSLIAISMMILIFLSLVFVKPKEDKSYLTDFRVPDGLIWLFIASLAGVFLLKADQWVAQKVCLNVLYVVTAGYYFQGLSIVSFYFNKMRVNYFLKAGLFFILGVHLFMVIVGLGLSDLWFNYRSKGYKKELMNRPSEEP